LSLALNFIELDVSVSVTDDDALLVSDDQVLNRRVRHRPRTWTRLTRVGVDGHGVDIPLFSLQSAATSA
jgi:hypothetical protein